MGRFKYVTLCVMVAVILGTVKGQDSTVTPLDTTTSGQPGGAPVDSTGVSGQPGRTTTTTPSGMITPSAQPNQPSGTPPSQTTSPPQQGQPTAHTVSPNGPPFSFQIPLPGSQQATPQNPQVRFVPLGLLLLSKFAAMNQQRQQGQQPQPGNGRR